MARPSKINEWLSSEGLILVRGWARSGLSSKEIAKNMGISETTFYDWQRKFPQFADSLKEGREIADFTVENALFKACTGGYYTEEREEVCKDGSVRKITTTRYRPPDVKACIFWLVNRCPDRWRTEGMADKLRQEYLDAKIEYTDSLTSNLRGDDVEIEDLSEADALIYGNSSDVVPGSWKPDQNDKNSMS